MSKFKTIAAAGLAFSVFVATPAFATPVFQSTIDATLSLTGVTIIEGTGDADVDVEVALSDLVFTDAFHDDDASSEYTENLSPVVGTSLTESPAVMQLNATGEAPGIGDAGASAAADIIISIFNNSKVNSVRLDFALDYAMTALALVDDDFLQGASASLLFTLTNSQTPAPIIGFDWLADTYTPDTEFSASDLLVFSIFVAPDSDLSLTLSGTVDGLVFSDLEGTASTVPIPSMAGLFAMAAFLGLRRRRRANA